MPTFSIDTRRRSVNLHGGIFFGALLLIATPLRAEGILVFAAASLTPALETITQNYAKVAPRGHKVRLSFAASSTLAQQIIRGAPADIYLSANQKWMEFVALRGRIQTGTQRKIVGNRLVIVIPGDRSIQAISSVKLPPSEFLGVGRLAVADPDHVPAGLYAKAALRSVGLWTQLRPRLARMVNVRAALALVARGEVPAGIVYASDATNAEGVKTLYRFPVESHPEIVYPGAIVSGRDRPEVQRFFDYLRSPSARAAFQRHGFAVD